ncbi:hypothetical protein GQ44DRAFT_616888, partial [Phaeosphaeriaceae sp. PMI808]
DTKRARVVQLYCPKYNATVDNSIITPSMGYEGTITHVKASFRLDSLQHVHLCDINGERLFEHVGCPSSLRNVLSGERLLVVMNDNERVFPVPELEVMLYLEDENLPKPLRKMSRDSRRNHLRMLRRLDAVQRRNILRLTLPQDDIVAALANLVNPTAKKMKTTYSYNQSERVIAGHWFVKRTFRCEAKCLAALAILSGATSGQSSLVEDYLKKAMMLRNHCYGTSDDTLLEGDVRAVISAFYEKAAMTVSTRPDTKASKAIDKRDTRRKAYSRARYGEKKVAADAAAIEDIGEDAAEAAYPCTKATEVGKLAGQLEKDIALDIYMEGDIEDDEDPVRIPGRFRYQAVEDVRRFVGGEAIAVKHTSVIMSSGLS